jgi:ribosomal protein L30E
MAKKKKILEEHIARIKKSTEEGKIVLGIKEVTAGIRKDEFLTVYLASNCPQEAEKDIKNIFSGEIIRLEQPNDELGTICKKPFSISVLGIKK